MNPKPNNKMMCFLPAAQMLDEAEAVVKMAMDAGRESKQYGLVVKLSNNLAAVSKRH